MHSTTSVISYDIEQSTTTYFIGYGITITYFNVTVEICRSVITNVASTSIEYITAITTQVVRSSWSQEDTCPS